MYIDMDKDTNICTYTHTETYNQIETNLFTDTYRCITILKTVRNNLHQPNNDVIKTLIIK